MIKKLRFIVPIFVLGLLASCGQTGLPVNIDPNNTGIDTPWEEYDIPVEELHFSDAEKNISINVGQTHEFHYTYSPKNATPESLSWESSNTAIVSLIEGNGGNYTAKGEAVGTAIITISGEAIEDVYLTVRVDNPIHDFALAKSSMDLDFGETEKIELTFDPVDTTQREMNYVVEDPTIAFVDEEGNVSALEKAGSTRVKVQSPYLNKELSVNVTVQDKYTYFSKFDVVSPELNPEVDSEFDLSVDVAPITHTADLSTVHYHTSTPELVRVDELTGHVTALEAGEAKVSASIQERGKVTTSQEITINVYEVKTTEVSFGAESKQKIQLNNRENSTHQLQVTLTTDPVGRNPSRLDLEYSVAPEGVVTVDEDGLVSVFDGGEARVTVTDKYSGKSDYVDFEVTLRSKSVVVTGQSSAYLNQEIVLTATVSPADATEKSVSWHVTSGDEDDLTLVEIGNTVAITSTEEGEYGITAICDGVFSDIFTFKFQERPVVFEAGKTYIVGSSNYKDKVSVDGASWDVAKYAYTYKESDKTDNQYAKYEYKATIEFRQYDEWKIRENVSDWRDIDAFAGEGEGQYQIGRYKIDEGAFKTGQMEVKTDENGNRSVKVLQEGKYDVYYAFYENEHPEGWYEVFVEESGLKVDTDYLYVEQGETATFVASNWVANTLNVYSKDESIATVDVDEHGKVTVTGVKVGDAFVVVEDAEKEIYVYIEVIEKGVPTAFDSLYYYLVGNKDFSSGESKEGASWDDPTKSLVFREVEHGEDLRNQWKVRVSLAANDEFRVRSEDYFNVYAERSDVVPSKINRDEEAYNVNFVVKEAGVYDLYLKQGHDYGYSLYIGEVPQLGVDKDYLTIKKGETDTITASNVTGALAAHSSDEDVATTSVTGNVITVTAVEGGDAVITVSDASNKAIQVSVTVYTESFDANKTYLVGNKSYATGVSGTGASWNDVNQALVFTEVEKGDLKKQEKVTITFTKGDEWRIREGENYSTAEIEVAGAILASQMHKSGDNVVVDVTGTYEIFYKTGLDDGHSIYVSLEEDTQFITIKVEDTVSVAGAWVAVWAWEGSGDGVFYYGQYIGDTVYIAIPKTCDKCIILRMASGVDASTIVNPWTSNAVWNQTEDINISTNLHYGVWMDSNLHSYVISE